MSPPYRKAIWAYLEVVDFICDKMVADGDMEPQIWDLSR
jgi:hypothetical protein